MMTTRIFEINSGGTYETVTVHLSKFGMKLAERCPTICTKRNSFLHFKCPTETMNDSKRADLKQQRKYTLPSVTNAIVSCKLRMELLFPSHPPSNHKQMLASPT